MTQPSKKYELFHYLRDTAYARTSAEHPGMIEFDEDGEEMSRLGFSADEAHEVVDELCHAHLVERLAEDASGSADGPYHERLLVQPIDDLIAATVIVAVD